MTPAPATPGPEAAPLRVLLVDDCADDAELVMLELQHAGIAAECRRVEREATLRDALATFAPDLVLSDLNLPGYSGRDAHALVREQAPGVPFVFVTGSTADGQPLPVADAVVLKDALATLPAVVRGLLAAKALPDA